MHFGLRSEAVHASALRIYFAQRKSLDTTPCILQSTSLFMDSFIPLLQLLQFPARFIGTPLCPQRAGTDTCMMVCTGVMPLFYISTQPCNMANHGKYDGTERSDALLKLFRSSFILLIAFYIARQ